MAAAGSQPIALAELGSHPAVVAGLVLDLRSDAAFASGHPRGAYHVPLVDGPDLAVRVEQLLPSIFLPARHQPLLVLAAEANLAARVATLLHARGRTLTDWAVWDSDDLIPSTVAVAAGRLSGRLWAPPPFLERWAGSLPPPAAGRVLDLACGSGRAAVWLASQGWRVTAIDHQPEALDLGRQLAASEGVVVDWRQDDLRREENLPAGPWSVVLMFRYLDRGLLARLPAVLAQGSVVVLRTFRDAPGYIGNPQPRHRLRPGEAMQLWPDGPCEVLVGEEGFDPDGKPAAGVVVRWGGVRGWRPPPPSVI